MKPGYRKFALAFAALLAATALMWAGKIDDGVYSTIVVAVVGGYLAANVTQKATHKES
jgi:hypothetical protein